MGENFQSLSSAQGKHYENHVRRVLQFRGWTIINDRPRKVDVGEIDIEALGPDGRSWLIECKGSWGKRPGLERSDTLLKAIALGWALKRVADGPIRYMVATTNLPKPGSKGELLLSLALAEGVIDHVEVI